MRRLLIGLVLGVATPALAQENKGDNEDKLPRLIEALGDEDAYKVRLQAAVLLGRTADPRAVDPLLEALADDPHYTVRAAAANALANLDEPRAISHIIRTMATDDDDFVRAEAARALEKYDREEALPYVVAAYGADDVAVRKKVVEYLAERPSAEARGVLTRGLGDEPEIFEVAERAIRELPEEERMAFLTAAAGHRDAEVRRGAVKVLHDVGTKAATEAILEIYRRDIEVDDVRDATRNALRDLREHIDIAAVVAEANQDEDKHPRAKALKLLGVLGGPEAEEALVKALEDEDIYLRGTAVMALRELGDPALVPDLEKLANDPANQRIAHLVRHTLKQLREKQSE